MLPACLLRLIHPLPNVIRGHRRKQRRSNRTASTGSHHPRSIRLPMSHHRPRHRWLPTSMTKVPQYLHLSSLARMKSLLSLSRTSLHWRVPARAGKDRLHCPHLCHRRRRRRRRHLYHALSDRKDAVGDAVVENCWHQARPRHLRPRHQPQARRKKRQLIGWRHALSDRERYRRRQ